MASWQFHIEITPLDSSDNQIPWTLQKNDAFFESLSTDLISIFGPKEEIYSGFHYGNYETSDVQIYFEENGTIGYFGIRLDIREVNGVFLDKVIAFLHSHHFGILIEDDILIQVNRESLVSSIKNSGAYRFVTDPVKFLEGISRGDFE